MAREDKNSGNAENNAPSDFQHDPVVDEMIMMFVHLDQVISFITKHGNLSESSKSLLKAIHLWNLYRDEDLSPTFRKTVANECRDFLRRQVNKWATRDISLENNKKIVPELMAIFCKREGWFLPEMRIAKYIIQLPMQRRSAQTLTVGRPTDRCLNVLICFLVEYCKTYYPKQKNHFALIASKLLSLSSKKPSWKKERKKIADRFAIMKREYDTKSIYDAVMNILLS